MSGLAFQRPIGAAADVKELEYCVALHQTVARDNATISSTDIRCLLASRYDLKLSQAQAAALVRSLAGISESESGGRNKEKKKSGKPKPSSAEDSNDIWFETTWDDNAGIEAKQVNLAKDNGFQQQQQQDQVQEEYLDLVQILSILLLPSLARAADEFQNGVHPPPNLHVHVGNCFTQSLHNFVYEIKSWSANRRYKMYQSCRPQPADILEQVLKAILKQTNNTGSEHDDSDLTGGKVTSMADERAPALNERLVEKLLRDHGEAERAGNVELIRDMVAVANTPSGRLDRAALVKATSVDLKEWEVESEDRLSTWFEDVFGTVDPATVTNLEFVDAVDKSGTNDGEQDLENLNCSHPNPISVDAYVDDPSSLDVAGEELISTQQQDIDDDTMKSRRRLRIFLKDWFSFLFKLCCFLCLPGKSMGLFGNERFNIDMVIDEHLSALSVVVIWLFFLFTAMLYASLIASIPTLSEVCDIKLFWCRCLDTIYTWAVVAILLSVFGLLMVLPLSYGNSARHRKPLVQLATISLPLGYALVPFLIVRRVEEGEDIANSTTSDLIQNDAYKRLQLVPLGIGFLLAFLFLLELLKSLFRWCCSFSTFLSEFLNGLTASSSAWADTRLKRAATRKVNKLLMNARRLHQPIELAPGILRESSVGNVTSNETMRNFVLDEERTEIVGGLGWTWYKIFDGTLFDTEGMWINTRLLIIQVAQVIVIFAVSVIMLGSVERIADQSEEARDDLGPNVPGWVRDFVPTRQMVYRALYPASFTAIGVMILLFMIYIPSAVSTVLKFRSQALPSLRSPLFTVYTKAVDSTYMNTANAIYGLLGSASLFYVIVGLILFLFQWPFSQDSMLRLLAWGLGLSITMGLKMVLTMGCRRVQYRNFYRIRRHSANLSALALECWYIGLGGSVLLGRITQFLFAALFWVGRIDVAFLSSDVVLFGYQFDYVPINFVKELLVHEAHRHPFLERLAQMYLLKLRHKDFAASSAAAAWRQLCIVAFFPWLAKNRVFNKERLAQAAAARSERRRREEEFGEGDLRASF